LVVTQNNDESDLKIWDRIPTFLVGFCPGRIAGAGNCAADSFGSILESGNEESGGGVALRIMMPERPTGQAGYNEADKMIGKGKMAKENTETKPGIALSHRGDRLSHCGGELSHPVAELSNRRGALLHPIGVLSHRRTALSNCGGVLSHRQGALSYHRTALSYRQGALSYCRSAILGAGTP